MREVMQVSVQLLTLCQMLSVPELCPLVGPLVREILTVLAMVSVV